MGFRDGHIIKFRKQIKNNHHWLTFQKMQSEFNEGQKTEKKEPITSEQSHINCQNEDNGHIKQVCWYTFR